MEWKCPICGHIIEYNEKKLSEIISFIDKKIEHITMHLANVIGGLK